MKRCGRADDVSTEANQRGFLDGEQMGSDDIFEVDSTIEELVYLDVAVVVRPTRRRVVVLLWKEARGSQDETGESVAAVEQLAEILRRNLRHAVNVPGDGPD